MLLGANQGHIMVLVWICQLYGYLSNRYWLHFSCSNYQIYTYILSEWPQNVLKFITSCFRKLFELILKVYVGQNGVKNVTEMLLS